MRSLLPGSQRARVGWEGDVPEPRIGMSKVAGDRGQGVLMDVYLVCGVRAYETARAVSDDKEGGANVEVFLGDRRGRRRVGGYPQA